MATSLTPDQIPENNNLPSPDLPSQPIPQTEVPASGPSSESLLAVIREQNQRMQELQNQLVTVKTTPAPAPEPTKEEQNKRFYEDPAGFMGEFASKIQKQLTETVAPLQEQYLSFKRDSVVDGFINQAKVDPRISRNWNPQLEAYVRQQIAQMPPAQVNEQAFINVAVMGVGLQSMGQIPSPNAALNNNPPAPPAPTNLPRNSEVIPPHLRPTNTPPAPNAQNGNTRQYRDLTENEARLAREMRMSKEDYLDMMDINKTQVVSTDIGKRA